ncbi:hypothetical protein [Chamaesiphon sp. VAR_48_metabat_403]|uniref:hypothetical protein n=1 Tax=Chamaesiphon sp. VAR_48_metabat_403 TaxID=2964700 RepID=UPI00286D7A76|nr:hypothetical protein [Chamaesiphon sp. VAR_48_metabat_403]
MAARSISPRRSLCPSVQLLQLARKWSRPPLQNLLAVQDPTQDLTFTNLEVTALRTYFQPFDRPQ